MKLLNALVMSAVVFFTTAIGKADTLLHEQSITYKNQRGSTLTLVWHTHYHHTGTLTGTFTTVVGDCQADIGKPMPAYGFFNGQAIAITVNFPHCQQIVTITGNRSMNEKQLYTLWLDTRSVIDPLHQHWKGTIIGNDTYHKL